ncbi:hypothetical protein Tco_0816504 [Tanacetum coccineum]
MATTQVLIVLDDSTFNPSMNQDDQVIGDEDASNEEFQTNKRKQTIGDEQPNVERTKKAKAWSEFEKVEKNGITKMKCNHCGSLLAYTKGSSEPKLEPAIVNGKYDHIRMQESIAHWILMHKHSFSIVEEAGLQGNTSFGRARKDDESENSFRKMVEKTERKVDKCIGSKQVSSSMVHCLHAAVLDPTKLTHRGCKEVFVAEQKVAAKEKDDEVNVVEEVVEVINTAKTVSAVTTTTATITTVDDVTLAQALMEIKSTKPKEKE